MHRAFMRIRIKGVLQQFELSYCTTIRSCFTMPGANPPGGFSVLSFTVPLHCCYLIFNVTIENTTQRMVTIQKRVTIFAS